MHTPIHIYMHTPIHIYMHTYKHKKSPLVTRRDVSAFAGERAGLCTASRLPTRWPMRAEASSHAPGLGRDHPHWTGALNEARPPPPADTIPDDNDDNDDGNDNDDGDDDDDGGGGSAPHVPATTRETAWSRRLAALLRTFRRCNNRPRHSVTERGPPPAKKRPACTCNAPPHRAQLGGQCHPGSFEGDIASWRPSPDGDDVWRQSVRDSPSSHGTAFHACGAAVRAGKTTKTGGHCAWPARAASPRRPLETTGQAQPGQGPRPRRLAESPPHAAGDWLRGLAACNVRAPANHGQACAASRSPAARQPKYSAPPPRAHHHHDRTGSGRVSCVALVHLPPACHPGPGPASSPANRVAVARPFLGLAYKSSHLIVGERTE